MRFRISSYKHNLLRDQRYQHIVSIERKAPNTTHSSSPSSTYFLNMSTGNIPDNAPV